uniref:Uncharacterized protein n=1 Tax=Aegilops tauschii subsp. strangulata TaxID=200361 RepID=A0A453TBD4_AEGTS
SDQHPTARIPRPLGFERGIRLRQAPILSRPCLLPIPIPIRPSLSYALPAPPLQQPQRRATPEPGRDRRRQLPLPPSPPPPSPSNEVRHGSFFFLDRRMGAFLNGVEGAFLVLVLDGMGFFGGFLEGFLPDLALRALPPSDLRPGWMNSGGGASSERAIASGRLAA